MEASNKRQTSLKIKRLVYRIKKRSQSFDRLLSPKTAATYSSTVTQYHRRDEGLTSLFGMGRGGSLVL